MSPPAPGRAIRLCVANFLGFALGFSAFGALGHGLTGDHGDALTGPQWLAHTLALLVASTGIASAQARGLGRPVAEVRWALVLLGAPTAFWAGYYVLGIPFDLLLTFALLGAAAGLLVDDLSASRVWRWRAALCFALALGPTAAVTYPIADQLQSALGGGLAGHVALFAFIGTAGGLATSSFLWAALRVSRARRDG